MNLIDVLNLDLDSLEKEYREIATVLAKIGLSDYESRSYVALIAKSHGTAEEIADLASIPRTSAYKALQSLKDKGLVTFREGRPIIFHPVELSEAKEHILTEISNTFEKLESVKGLMSEKGIPQLVYTLTGKESVVAKIGEMLDAATKEFIISTPAMGDIRVAHAHRFKEAVKRGVEVILVTEPSLKVPMSTKVYRKKDLIATDVISDGRTAMIASPDLSLCGFSDNPFIASHLANFMRIVLDKLQN